MSKETAYKILKQNLTIPALCGETARSIKSLQFDSPYSFHRSQKANNNNRTTYLQRTLLAHKPLYQLLTLRQLYMYVDLVFHEKKYLYLKYQINSTSH